MATGKQWKKEINKMTKDELTVYLAAFKSLVKWDMFKREFQLHYFNWMVPDMERRIEELAKLEMAGLTECAFCDAPVKKIDRFGFCEQCDETFKILTNEELVEIEKRTGFRHQTPDREFTGTGV